MDFIYFGTKKFENDANRPFCIPEMFIRLEIWISKYPTTAWSEKKTEADTGFKGKRNKAIKIDKPVNYCNQLRVACLCLIFSG